ncbi:MAG: BrnT family toxin [Candidatus Binatia bacterium]
MEIKFDPRKNAINLRRHKVPLTEGDGVLNDPLALTIEDDTAEGEQRFISIGMNTFGRLMVVVYTHRGEDLRLISVRPAEPKERRAYEEGV